MFRIINFLTWNFILLSNYKNVFKLPLNKGIQLVVIIIIIIII
jgi:hypothetical protein